MPSTGHQNCLDKFLRAIFRTLTYLEPEASSKSCQTCNISCIFRVLAWSEQFIHALSGIFSYIQGYWCVLSHIHKRGTVNRKKCRESEKKGPDCAHLWVKFSIDNVVLRVSRRKSAKIFPCGVLFSYVFHEMFITVY